ncbi:forkhead box protein D4-like 1 [Sphaerodactylus townsendi]|uniref:forkhead box protein D4-like 1 n=1 Tax=Sphaerodactylus townsendi TaxID=933632 RepID=UPI002026BF45|nr:forkhead box protein D4-like 1 [Sphaerodactylus townsendi]
MEETRAGGPRQPGVSFTIDYLLFDKGKASQGVPEPRDLRGPGFSGGGEEPAAAGRELQEPPDLLDKPNLSYIALISTAILSSPEKKLLLCDIYQWIMDKYPYFKNKEKSWRNSVRHNLSLNECFVKAGRSDNGKGHFWAIHPANLEDFSKGDYHRRRARRRIRRMAVNFGPHLPYAFYGLSCCPTRYCLGCSPYAHPAVPGLPPPLPARFPTTPPAPSRLFVSSPFLPWRRDREISV